MRSCPVHELMAAPELGIVAIVEHALEVLSDALHVEHPTIDDDFAVGDPQSLQAARIVVVHIDRLVLALGRYQAAVRISPTETQDDLPF